MATTMRLQTIIAAGLLVLSPTRADAATISVHRTEAGVSLHLSGAIEQGDDKSLIRAMLDTDAQAVSFDSPGGSLLAGLEIGRAIHLRGMATIVDDGKSCASACGLAWLGGTRRVLNGTGRVGFHAAYYVGNDGEPIESGHANALIGAYLSKIGMSDDAVVYLTKASPITMQWLTSSDAERLGIHVTFPTGRSAPPTPPIQPIAPPAIAIPRKSTRTCYVADVRPPDAWLAVRSEPHGRRGVQLARMLPGEAFEMLGERNGDWYFSRTSDGVVGWVSWAQARWIVCP